MTATELIRQLQFQVDTHGDCVIETQDENGFLHYPHSAVYKLDKKEKSTFERPVILIS